MRIRLASVHVSADNRTIINNGIALKEIKDIYAQYFGSVPFLDFGDLLSDVFFFKTPNKSQEPVVFVNQYDLIMTI